MLTPSMSVPAKIYSVRVFFKYLVVEILQKIVTAISFKWKAICKYLMFKDLLQDY